MSRLLWGVIAPAAIVLPLAIAIARIKHLQKPLRLFMYYLLFGGSINLVAVLLASKGINNMPLGHLFTIGEALFLLCFYHRLTNNAQTRRWLTISAALFIVLFAANLVFLQNLFTYNSYSRSLEAFMLMTVSICFLYQQITALPAWFHNPFIWITIGLLVYFSGSFFLFGFAELMSAQIGFYRMAWAIHSILLMIMYVLSAIAFLQTGRQYRGIDFRMQ